MKAPELIVTKWLNSKEPISLESLRGKVVAIHAFQMLCPGCVMHGLPQAQKVFELFSEEQIVVLGLHTVFEHHEAMKEPSLKAFLHEFRLQFPVGIDEPTTSKSIPQTMKAYQMRGTPSWVLIDRSGEIRLHTFGKTEDLFLGAEIAKLAYEGLDSKITIYKT